MEPKNAKAIIMYYYNIPEMIASLEQERHDTEDCNRLLEITTKIRVLIADAEQVKEYLDMIDHKYKLLFMMRYLDKYSWVRISVELGVPNSTVRSWHTKAVKYLAELLDQMPMAEEVLHRALYARN